MPASVEIGKNEALFRAVNDRIRDVSDDLEPSLRIEFVCECSRTDCMGTVPLTLLEYEAVRSDATWFTVLPEHFWDDRSEHVREKHELYWVLEKDGAAGAVAEALDD